MKRSTFITWEQLKVGTVILVAIGVMVLAVFKLGQATNLFTKRYQLVAFLQSTNGLVVGGSVTVAGQIAGTVKQIDFLPPDNDTTRNLKVTLDVDEQLKEQVRADSRGRLRTLGLLGDKVFDISPGTPKFNRLAIGDTIVMGQSLDYEAVISQASLAVGDMVSLTHDLREISGGIVRGEGTMGQLITNRSLYDQLNGTLTRSNALIEKLQNPNGTVGRMLGDPALYVSLTTMISSVDSLVKSMNSNTGTVGRMLHDDTLYTKLISIANGADSLTRLLTAGNGFVKQMLTDQQLYDQLVKAVTDLNAILADVRVNPGRYTKGMVKVF